VGAESIKITHFYANWISEVSKLPKIPKRWPHYLKDALDKGSPVEPLPICKVFETSNFILIIQNVFLILPKIG